MNYLQGQSLVIGGRKSKEIVTPQSEPMPLSNQQKNNAGGYTWVIDDWGGLHRFLILGSESNTYYASSRALTAENANAVARCIQADGRRVVDIVVEISDKGRAPKNDPALFVLAMTASLGNDDTRQYALSALPKVARIPTHLFHFVAYAQAMRGWGRGLRDAVARWYLDKPPDDLAYQMIKYRQRDGWTHRDLLRLSHPKPKDDEQKRLFQWATHGVITDIDNSAYYPLSSDARLSGYKIISTYSPDFPTHAVNIAADVIKAFKLPRECVPTALLNHREVWEALLPDMPLTAMIRNLATMTRVGMFESQENVDYVCEQISSSGLLQKSRVHPLAMLIALKTYEAGHGARGRHEWTPVQAICEALELGFYKSFHNAEPTGKRLLIGLDVSGSMAFGEIAGMVGITPRVASSAMSLIHHRVEESAIFTAFSHELIEIKFDGQISLNDMMSGIDRISMGCTDCALPIIHAINKGIETDLFIVYTDNETWCGNIHPVQALQLYRHKSGINAKMVVVGMTSDRFSIADPNDAGMLDVVGFDAAFPQILHDFALHE